MTLRLAPGTGWAETLRRAVDLTPEGFADDRLRTLVDGAWLDAGAPTPLRTPVDGTVLVQLPRLDAVTARLCRRGPGPGRGPVVRDPDRAPGRRPRPAVRPGVQHRLLELSDERARARRAGPAPRRQRGRREDPVAGRGGLPDRGARSDAPGRPAGHAGLRFR